MVSPMSATVSPISSPSTPPPAVADTTASNPIGPSPNQIPPPSDASLRSLTPTLSRETSQPPVTPRDRPEPKAPISATYTALPTEDGQTGTKKQRRGCWEAFQGSTWGFELLALLFAMASTVAVCVVLAHANNRLLSDWTLPIQPSSLISVFSTLAKAALMAPIASVVSQMKWIWFEEPRNLAHLQSFDKASRGPWGAANLIWSLNSRARGWTTRAACVLTIAALAFEPTAQQVISFETRETPVTNATALLSVASNWNSSSFRIGDFSSKDQIGMQSSLLNAVGPRPRELLPKFECTAPTCSWEQVETLGACSVCSAAPRPAWSLLRDVNNSFVARAPPNVIIGPALTEENPFPNVTMRPFFSIYDMATDTMMDPGGQSFLRFAAVNYSANANANTDDTDLGTWTWGQNDTVDYTLCRIHPCIKTFENVTVRNGVYKFNNRTTKWLMPEQERSVSGANIYHTEDPGSATDWVVDFDTAQKANQVLGALFDSGEGRGSMRRFEFQQHSYASGGSLAAGVSRVFYEGDLNMIMDAFSEVMSAEMRNDDNIAVQNQTGIAWEPQTFIVVNWLWMICPLAILAATTATLAVAMVRTSKHPLAYKDSAVGLLSLGIGHVDPADTNKVVRGDTVGQHHTAYRVEAEASGLTARLHKDDNGDFMLLKC